MKPLAIDRQLSCLVENTKVHRCMTFSVPVQKKNIAEIRKNLKWTEIFEIPKAEFFDIKKLLKTLKKLQVLIQSHQS